MVSGVPNGALFLWWCGVALGGLSARICSYPLVAGVAKRLRQRLVAPPFGGSNPLARPSQLAFTALLVPPEMVPWLPAGPVALSLQSAPGRRKIDRFHLGFW